ncbi:MAG: GDP-mannose 4,6-dehydratase, partial [Pseudomonadota bacterium]
EYSAVPDTDRIDHLDELQLHYGDLSDSGSLTRLISQIIPDEIYNMAAMSHVRVSFDTPEHTANINALGTLRILETIRALGLENHTRFYQASSSEMFGDAPAPQDENTPFAPCSPYGSAKLFGYWTVRNYRDAYGIHASNGILFNHESPIRGEEFVTRKITKAVCEIEAGLRDSLSLGNLDARRDWGHARDYMGAVYKIVQQDAPDDYVVASGETHSVREFVEKAFAHVDITIEWAGEGVEEKGIDAATGHELIVIDEELFRPNEIKTLQGNPVKAFQKLGWAPKTSFDDLVKDMVNADRIMGQKVKLYA